MISRIKKKLRSAIGGLVLHGPILRIWCRRKFLQLEKLFLYKMVESSTSPSVKKPLISSRAGEPLKKIAFIADIMWEESELIPELSRICDIKTLDLRPVLSKMPTEIIPQIVCKHVSNFISSWGTEMPDAILFYARGGLLSGEIFSIIRKHWSCPLLGMNLDDKVTFWPYGIFSGGDENYRKWVNSFDLNITNCRIASSWYHQEGVSYIYTPPGLHIPEGMTQPLDANFKYPLTFLGSHKLDRDTLISRLHQAGLPITVFGKGWPKAEWVPESSSIFRSSQMNLGIGLATPNLATIKARDFECPGLGACYLTTYNWELANWWDIGKEILCYRNEEELIEIFSWYRNRPDDCLKIAQAAWKRSINEHTWERRFRKIFQHVGFDV